MKKVLVCLLTLTLSIVSLWANSDVEAENSMRELNYIAIAVDHEHASFQPGFSLGQQQALFPLAMLNIPFGGVYYLKGGLGAGADMNKEGELTLLQLGMGSYNKFENSEDLFYSIGISIRSFQSQEYSSTILSGEFQLEQYVQNVRLGIGVVFGIQDYVISGSGYYPQADDRLYVTSLNVTARSPYGNISVNGTPYSLKVGLSWTFKLEDVK